MNIYFKEDFTAAHWRDWEHCCSVRVAGCFSSPNLVLKVGKSLWCLVHIEKQKKLGFDVHSSGSSRKDYMHKQGLKEQMTKLTLLFLQPFVYPGCQSKVLTTFSKGLTLSQILQEISSQTHLLVCLLVDCRSNQVDKKIDYHKSISCKESITFSYTKFKF